MTRIKKRRWADLGSCAVLCGLAMDLCWSSGTTGVLVLAVLLDIFRKRYEARRIAR